MDKKIDINRVNEGLAVMLAQEMHQYCMEGEQRTNFSQTNLGDYFTKPQHQRIQDIGEFLNGVGGFYLMVKVCEAMPDTGSSKINYLWSGIGTWQA